MGQRIGQGSAWRDIAGVCLCLSAQPLIAAIWQFNLRGAERSSRLVTRAGHYRAWRQPIASAINDKGCRGGSAKKSRGVEKDRGWERRWRRRDEGRGEERYGRIKVVTPLKVSSWWWSGWQTGCQLPRNGDIHLMPHNLKNTAPRTCTHINAHRHSHRHSSLIENAAGEFSVSHCFMNSIYKVLAVCAALLVVSSGCAVVKVMTGCEYKKNQFMKTPQLPRGPASAAHRVTTGTAATAKSRSSGVYPARRSQWEGIPYAFLRHLSYFITPSFTFSPSNFFFLSWWGD